MLDLVGRGRQASEPASFPLLQHLIDLYIMRSNATGNIDYAYLANQVERHWHGIKASENSRAATNG